MTRLGFTVVAALLALVLGGHLIVRQAVAQGLLVAPTRVVFEGRTRSAGITLVNRGDVAATYRISLRHFRMNEFGRLEAVEEPQPRELFSADFIRFSPRP